MQLERYRLESEIGRGAMATVYQAYDTKAERPVALKLLHRRFLSDEAIRARFIQEAKTVAQMRHRAIVPILHAAQVGEDIFLVMPLMPGGSLADRLRRGPLPIAETLEVLERIASALDYAHTKGVIHRDVKPDNILFDESGQAYLADFGVIKLVESTLTLTGTGLIGTPAYMSLEQVRGAKQLDGRSDIYGLGVVLFEMLAGRVPYDGESEMDVAMKHISAPIPNIRSFMGALSSGWQKVINRAMAKKPEERFQTGAELMSAVRQLAAKQPAKLDRRLPLALTAAALLLLVGASMYVTGVGSMATATAEVTSVAAVEPTQSPPTGAPPAEDATATGTASATPAATPVPAQAAVLYTDAGHVPLTLSDAIPVQDKPLVMQIDSTNGELEPVSLIGAARSRVELATVDGTNHRVSLRLGPGSDVFVHTGGYTGEIVTLGSRQGVIQAEPGACLSITVPIDSENEPIKLGCQTGECRYSMENGEQARLAPGEMILFNPRDNTGLTQPLSEELVAAYGALVLPVIDDISLDSLCNLATSTIVPPLTSSPSAPPSLTSTPTPQQVTITPTRAATLPVLIGPAHGVYHGQIIFEWLSRPELAYQVILRNVDRNYSYESEWVSGGSWTIDIPADQYGNWVWQVTDTNGQTSKIGSFVFDPHPINAAGIWRYDMNGDCIIDLYDIEPIDWHYNCSVGDACYNQGYDFNGDGLVNELDSALMSEHVGQAVPNCTP